MIPSPPSSAACYLSGGTIKREKVKYTFMLLPLRSFSGIASSESDLLSIFKSLVGKTSFFVG